MTAPRPIVPGTTYAIARRCTQRQFLLRPDPKTTKIYEYCLAEAVARFDMVLIGWGTMSNHHHFKVHDKHGVLPAFLAHLHKMLAKALNFRWSRWENFFAAEQVCVTKCVDVSDVLDKLVYALVNPVADHLVEKVRAWPGASSFDFLDGRVKVLERPKGFFREDGAMPKRVTLKAEVPPEWDGTREAWAEAVRERVAQAEQAARDERARTGRRVMGRRALQRVSAFDTPNTHAPRRNLRPFIACKNRQRRIATLSELRAFRKAYRKARDAFVAGVRDAVFPAGTYLMRLLGACCVPFAATAAQAIAPP